MYPYRTMLFVPAHRDGWSMKGIRAGADAVILDLEDSVPEAEKDRGRDCAAAAIAALEGVAGEVCWVRPNALDTDHFASDLEAVVRPGLTGLLLPKIRTAADVQKFDGAVTAFELRAGVPRGTVKFALSLETAAGVATRAELAISSPRVVALQAATAKDGDISREIGFRWSPEGLETLSYRSDVVVTSRAAGLQHPLCGVWQELEDLDGLRWFAEQNRSLGFGGQLVIHPSHISIVNEVFSISDLDIDRYRRLIQTFEAAERDGVGAARFEGEHIDIAHVKTARAAIEIARRQGRDIQ
jgi:citrate lyase subunit beta/citryl-CoA lyase